MQYKSIVKVRPHKKKGGFTMARPKKSISHPHRITIRFTDMEYGLITDAAKEADLTISEYIRQMVIKGKIAIRYEVIADIPELQKLTSEFGKIGNNLNQIARYFHTGGIHSKAMQDEIRSCITEIFRLRTKVAKMAGDYHGDIEAYRK